MHAVLYPAWRRVTAGRFPRGERATAALLIAFAYCRAGTVKLILNATTVACYREQAYGDASCLALC